MKETLKILSAKRTKILIEVILVFLLIVVVNVVVNRFNLRMDITSDHKYTLSDATKEVLKEVKQPISITAYFSEEVHPTIDKVRRDFKEQLLEYQNMSDDKIVFRFINPNENEQLEQQAQRLGVIANMVEVQERDQMKKQRAYMGAVLQLGEKKEVIPAVQEGAAMEYALTTAIKKMSIQNKPTIAFIQGHGEPHLMQMEQVYKSLSVLYQVEPLRLNDLKEISSEYKTIVVISPRDTFPQQHLDMLSTYLEKGGRMFVGLSRVQADFSTASLDSGRVTLFEQWLADKGVLIEENCLMDMNCGEVNIQQQYGMYIYNVPVKFPYIPIISNFSKHTITKGLKSLQMPFTSTIVSTVKGKDVVVTPLLKSSVNAATCVPPMPFDVHRNWIDSDFPTSHLPVSYALSGPIFGSNYTKMVVVGNGEFATTSEVNSESVISKEIVSFVVNSIDWLSDDTGLIDLRIKEITNRPIIKLADNIRNLLKYMNLFLPILLVIIYGLVRYRKNINRRKRWEEDIKK